MPLSSELTLLVWSMALAFAQMCAAAGYITLTQGFAVSLGNRAGFVPPEGPLARALRAHRNMVESLVVFAAAVLVAHAAGREDALTTLGAILFFWGRLAYVILYVTGVAYARTVAWTVAVTGILLILLRLF